MRLAWCVQCGAISRLGAWRPKRIGTAIEKYHIWNQSGGVYLSVTHLLQATGRFGELLSFSADALREAELYPAALVNVRLSTGNTV